MVEGDRANSVAIDRTDALARNRSAITIRSSWLRNRDEISCGGGVGATADA
jgi:hypothetical protein